jgi:hypothetical protein
MKPGYLTLPTIWRGCTWPAVRLQWLNQDGHPINLNGWYPRAFTRHFDLNAAIVDARNGVTRVALNKFETSELAQGVEDFDWIWLQRGGGDSLTLPPMLKGKVTVRHPVTNPEALVVTRIGGGSNYVKILPDPGPNEQREFYKEFHQNPVGLYAMFTQKIRDQLTDMRARGQNQIALVLYYVNGIRWPNPGGRTVPWLFGHSIIPFIPPDENGVPQAGDPYQATLSTNLQQNMIDLLGLLNELEFTELHMRYGAQGKMSHSLWGAKPLNDNITDAVELFPPEGTVEGTTLYATHFRSSPRICDVLVATNVFTLKNPAGDPINHNLKLGDKVVFTTTGTFPAPIAAGKIYFVIADSLSPTHFKVSVTQGGAELDVTTTGSGTMHLLDPDNEPPGGSEWSVWYKFTGDGSDWAFQCSTPAHILMEAFAGNLPHLNRIAYSDGVHPLVFNANFGFVHYIRVSPRPSPPLTYYPLPFSLSWEHNSPVPPTIATPDPPLPVTGEPWDAEHEGMMQESQGFVANVAELIDSNKGNLRVLHSMLGENLSTRLIWDPINRRWCSRMWSYYVARHGPLNSTAGSLFQGAAGTRATLDFFRIANLPLPGSYAADVYGNVYEALKGCFNELRKEGGGEFRKRFYLQETFYNDSQTASELRRVIRETGMNFSGIYQWTRDRNLPVGKFPDVYPFMFDKYGQL